MSETESETVRAVALLGQSMATSEKVRELVASAVILNPTHPLAGLIMKMIHPKVMASVKEGLSVAKGGA